MVDLFLAISRSTAAEAGLFETRGWQNQLGTQSGPVRSYADDLPWEMRSALAHDRFHSCSLGEQGWGEKDATSCFLFSEAILV